MSQDRPVSDKEFAVLNRSDDSFFKGQFSARSTSLGGSNEILKGKTRDERFSDYTNAEKLFVQGSCSDGQMHNPLDISGDQSKGETNFPDDFFDMHQEGVENVSCEFYSDCGKDIIDAAEKEFEDSNVSIED